MQMLSTKSFLWSLATSIVLIGAIVWVGNHGYIEVETNRTGSKNVVLRDTRSGTTTTFTSEKDTIRRFVSHGTYEILVEMDAESSYQVGDSGRFLMTKRTSTAFQAERERTFIGNNPENCMFYSSDMLYSYACDLNYQDLKAHLPASQSSPTTTQLLGENDYAFPILGILSIEGVPSLLLGSIAEHEDEKIDASVRNLSSPSIINTSVPINQTNPDLTYRAVQHAEGFVVYDENLEDVTLYKKPYSGAQKISIEKPNEKGFAVVSFDTFGGKYLAAFSDNAFGEKSTQDESTSRKGKTILKIKDSSGSKSATLNYPVNKAFFCGDNVCALSGKTLRITSVGQGKPREVFKAHDIEDAFYQNSGLYFLQDGKVITYNIDNKQGYVSYDLGPYKHCGNKPLQNNTYILCLINPKQNKVALLISDQPATSKIDKAVATLLDAPFVDDISAYKNFVYIIPDTGEPVYVAGQGYTDNPTLLEDARRQINTLIDDQKIDRTKFTIINSKN